MINDENVQVKVKYFVKRYFREILYPAPIVRTETGSDPSLKSDPDPQPYFGASGNDFRRVQPDILV